VRHLLGVVSAVLVVVACGPAASSGVEQTKQLLSIDDEEARKLCAYRHELDQDALGTERDFCMGIAFVLDATSDECQDALADCRANEGYAGRRDFDPHCDTATAQSMFGFLKKSCDISVGEYENCMEASFSQWSVFTKTLSCDELDTAEAPARPTACKKVDEDCPGLVGG
jgi:hypothetical protein